MNLCICFTTRYGSNYSLLYLFLNKTVTFKLPLINIDLNADSMDNKQLLEIRIKNKKSK